MDYDLANTWFGNADAPVRYTAPWITVTGGLRQYRPHFDLWTIWGAFSPVPYHAADAAVFVRPIRSLELRARGERYAYSDTETETPLVDVDDDGWRLGFGASYSLGQTWRFDAGYREEYGPGASSHGFDALVTWLPTTELSITGVRIHPGPPARVPVQRGLGGRGGAGRRVEPGKPAPARSRGSAVLGDSRPA